MPQMPAYPHVGSTAMRGAGAAIRTAQDIGIEWLDLGKQSYDDLVGTTGRMAGSRDPGEALRLYGAFLQRAGERIWVRSTVMSDRVGTLLGHIAAGVPRPRGSRHES